MNSSVFWVATRSMGVFMAIDMMGNKDVTVMFKNPLLTYTQLRNKFIIDVIRYEMMVRNKQQVR